MYVPSPFREDRIPALHDVMRQSGLPTLVTVGRDGPVATPVPVLLEPEPAPYGRLCGHLARGNPQAGDVRADIDALVLFSGPDAYVSPSWYPTKQQTGKVVPTWNYVAVHAYGRLVLFDDPDRLLALVTALTEQHEAGRSQPWKVSDAPADFIQGMLRGIIGFEMTITRIDGKRKLSQNRPAVDRAGVADGLMTGADPRQVAVGRLVAALDGDDADPVPPRA